MIAGHVDAELSPVAGFRQAAVTHVILEVEMLIVDPVRKVEFERYVHETAPKQRTHVQAALDVRQDVFETDDAVARHR